MCSAFSVSLPNDSFPLPCFRRWKHATTCVAFDQGFKPKNLRLRVRANSSMLFWTIHSYLLGFSIFYAGVFVSDVVEQLINVQFTLNITTNFSCTRMHYKLFRKILHNTEIKMWKPKAPSQTWLRHAAFIFRPEKLRGQVAYVQARRLGQT